MTDIHTSYAVLVLGDTDTVERMDMLADKAAEQGATITETFAFDPGQAAAEDDLTEIDAVVAALSRAIVSHTDIWSPFPAQDLCREQHWRRLSVALQRHGLNLLMGPALAPSPVEGGYNEIDAGLRKEVRSVDELDYAALSRAGMRSLSAEIERALVGADEAPLAPPEFESPYDAPREFYFSTAEVAGVFGRSPNWINAGLRSGSFTYPDGSPVEPLRTGRGGKRRFTVPMVRAMAWSAYRRGRVDAQRLEGVLAALSRAQR
jgi:hypothetical protein